MTRNSTLYRRGLGGLALLCGGGALVGAGAGGCAQDAPIESKEHPPHAASEAPPPVSGGTTLLTRDGRFAVVADEGADAVYIIALEGHQLVKEVLLEPGDEPGRLIEGDDGQIFVALRRGGAVARLDVASGETARQSVCATPRGLAWDADAAELFVACADGELHTLDAELARLERQQLDADLRDVVVKDGRVFVSKFRSAEVLEVGSGAERGVPHAYTSPTLVRSFEAAVAYRMKLLPDGAIMLLHQRALAQEIPTGSPVNGQTYYGGNCDEVIVHAAATVFDDTLRPVTPPDHGTIGTLVLPLDMDVSSDGAWLAVVGAGSEQLAVVPLSEAVYGDAFDNCFSPSFMPLTVLGEPVSVVFTPDAELLVQTRQPATLTRITREGEVRAVTHLPVSGGRDWGHALFHKQAGPFSPIACASCHPEGREDGRTWQFANIGPRRTQTVAGGVLDTMPLHWDGDMTNLHDLMGEVFVNRMGGAAPPADRVESLGVWMQTVSALPASPAKDQDAVARGEAVFHDQTVGCATCHSGEAFTSNETLDVGTGKPFQVPSLRGIAMRAPFMHDGCAPTLRARFDDERCGGGDAHGKTSQLSAAELDDLIAYLTTL